MVEVAQERSPGTIDDSAGDRNKKALARGDWKAVEGPVRLNLGCGKKLWEGFVNVDFPNNWGGLKPDVECDITKLPFPENWADEIHAIHVIEHFRRDRVEEILQHWKSVLKPGGMIVIECPCLEKIAHHLQSKERSMEWLRLTLLGLYGEYWHKDDAMIHKWCYSSWEMQGLLDRHFTDPQLSQPVYHQKLRDMRMTAIK